MEYFMYVETTIVEDAESEKEAIEMANATLAERAGRGEIEWLVEQEEDTNVHTTKSE